ncbi:hypothetical protein INR49_018254, partial [Caranx melampygus]
MAVLFCFHAAFMLFCISVTRYMAIAHHRFYSKRMTFWTCVAVVCMVWTLSVAMAFPPVFDVGTYKFIREEDQCIFEHRYFKANDTLGFMLMLAVLILATHVVYMKLLLFEYKHRKMKPVQMVPAISQNWTFHGPGATGQAAANWIAGFGRGPMPPTLLGIRQNLHNQNRRLLGMEEFKAEKQLGRMFYVITLLFLFEDTHTMIDKVGDVAEVSSIHCVHVLYVVQVKQGADPPSAAILCLEDTQVELDAPLHHSVGTIRATAASGVALINGLSCPDTHLSPIV